MIWTTTEILEILRRYRGQRLLGFINCGDCVEIVWDENANRANLLTIYNDGRIANGFVIEPEKYAADAGT